MKLVAVLAAVAVLVFPACNRRPSPTIQDAAFVRQANALCGRELPPLRAERKDIDSFGRTPNNDRTVTAAKIDRVASELDRISEALGGLPVRFEDQTDVASWLEEWATFTGIGRQYAVAVRSEKASVYTSIAAEGNGPVRRIAAFARANHIDQCVL